MIVDGGDDLAREGKMRLFLIPKRVKPLDGFLCRPLNARRSDLGSARIAINRWLQQSLLRLRQDPAGFAPRDRGL